jgi:hypothetical protein
MSTPVAGARPPLPEQANTTIKVVSHSMLLYWWPVWAAGFVLTFLTFLDGSRLAVVPEGTHVRSAGAGMYEVTVPSGQPDEALDEAAAAAPGQPAFPVRVARDKNYGVLFVILLLLVILITTVPVRGLWSAMVILVLVLVSLLLAFTGLWGPLLDALGRLHIYISAAGYLFLSVVLFLFWLVAVLVFDQRRYMTFSPGQLIVHREVGDMQQVYDTTQLTVEKRRSDLFRHWILGLGSGDLVVSLPGTTAQQLELPNVLFVAAKVRQIADLMKTRPVVAE